MYNFAIPSTLKAWLDHVLRAGVTFKYTETGPQACSPASAPSS
jgi:FMN-dependent NADH-azoreductase